MENADKQEPSQKTGASMEDVLNSESGQLALKKAAKALEAMSEAIAPDKDGLCPCGSGKPYEECCKIYHDGQAWPNDPEQMVRARYCAYAKHQWQFLVDSYLATEAEPGPSAEQLAERSSDVHWAGLNIVGSGISAEEDHRGDPYVDFYAYYILSTDLHQISEHAFFSKKDDKLYYTGGVEYAPEPVHHVGRKIGRNDPCPCGSGKKYKKCCGRPV